MCTSKSFQNSQRLDTKSFFLYMNIFDRTQIQTTYPAPSSWLSIQTIDMHTCGEPLRVILSGFPEIRGNSVLERRSYVKENFDNLRTALMFEPRGHSDMYGCILTPPNSDSDFGIIFMHNEGYSTMCGHATIAIAKLAVEMEWVQKEKPITTIKIDAPCGTLTAYVAVENGQVNSVSFDNVPSFVVGLDQEVEVSGLGSVHYDLAYGGAFYAFVDADSLGIGLDSSNTKQLIEAGMNIKKAVASSRAIAHPFEHDLSFLYGTIFTGKPHGAADSRNVCIFAEGELDRSPTGSGVSARMAIHHAKGELHAGESMIVESILDTTFVGSIKEALSYGGMDAVIPNVSGTAYITGQHQFLIDPNDPQKDGFILR